MALSKYQNADEMEANIDNAAPYIGENGNWFRWNATAKEYQDTGKPARGAKGDKGTKGDTGATPNITVGTITTGEPGTPATVNITGTTPNLVMDMQIPRGADGTGVGDMTQAVYDPNHRRQDIFSTFSNINFLINERFMQNQRGKTAYTGTGYTVDRWNNFAGGNVSIEVTSNGLRLSSASGYVRLNQVMESDVAKFLAGKTVTLSMCVKGSYGAYLAQDATQSNVLGYITGNTTDFEIVTTTVTLSSGLDYLRAEIRNPAGECTVQWAKLELGTVATPFVPRSYGEELALCQRYTLLSSWQLNGIATRISADYIMFYFFVPTTMRVAPTIIGEPEIYTSNSVLQTGFTFEVGAYGPNMVAVYARKTAHGVTGNAFAFFSKPNGFDAEIY